MTKAADRSYRALLAVPAVGRLLLGMQIARISGAMVSVTLVLFTLDSYRSAGLAGLATFCSIFPGLLVSPIAGALLDRHGRTRLVVTDYLVALAALVLIGALALAGPFPAWLLLLIASIASLTSPLSATGLRSVIPLIVPSHLWERANALDSIGYVIASIVGPAIAAWIVALWGGAVGFIIIGLTYGVAAIVISKAPDPPTSMPASRSLLSEAWKGLAYTWNNRTLRGLGFCISVANLINGAFTIIVPLLVLDRFLMSKQVVGIMFGIQGVTAMISAVIFGGLDSRNRERIMLAVPMIASGFATALLLTKSSPAMLVFVMAAVGLLNGPLDVALFTVRQRRTDPAWTGRAFAVSMSFNYLGIPVGSAVAGLIAVRSIEISIAFGAATSVLAGFMALALLPSAED